MLPPPYDRWSRPTAPRQRFFLFLLGGVPPALPGLPEVPDTGRGAGRALAPEDLGFGRADAGDEPLPDELAEPADEVPPFGAGLSDAPFGGSTAFGSALVPPLGSGLGFVVVAVIGFASAACFASSR